LIEGSRKDGDDVHMRHEQYRLEIRVRALPSEEVSMSIDSLMLDRVIEHLGELHLEEVCEGGELVEGGIGGVEGDIIE